MNLCEYIEIINLFLIAQMTIIGCLSLRRVRSIVSKNNVTHYNYAEIENYYNFPKTSDTFFRSTHIIYYLFSDNLRKHNKKEMRNFPCGRWPCGNISIISFFLCFSFINTNTNLLKCITRQQL